MVKIFGSTGYGVNTLKDDFMATTFRTQLEAPVSKELQFWKEGRYFTTVRHPMEFTFSDLEYSEITQADIPKCDFREDRSLSSWSTDAQSGNFSFDPLAEEDYGDLRSDDEEEETKAEGEEDGEEEADNGDDDDDEEEFPPLSDKVAANAATEKRAAAAAEKKAKLQAEKELRKVKSSKALQSGINNTINTNEEVPLSESAFTGGPRGNRICRLTPPRPTIPFDADIDDTSAFYNLSERVDTRATKETQRRITHTNASKGEGEVAKALGPIRTTKTRATFEAQMNGDVLTFLKEVTDELTDSSANEDACSSQSDFSINMVGESGRVDVTAASRNRTASNYNSGASGGSPNK